MISMFEETSQITYATAITFGCFPGLEVKTLLLKIPYTMDTGIGETELELTGSLCPEEWLSQY